MKRRGLVREALLRIAWPLPDARAARWIGTDAVLLGLERFAAHGDRRRDRSLDRNMRGDAIGARSVPF